MYKKFLCAGFVASSLVLVPVKETRANDAAALIGGALIGGIIVNEVHKNKQRQRQKTTQQTTRTTKRSSGISTAQRQQNRDVQTSLNYFGYNVGAVDGSLGRKSRVGISRYQTDMGYNTDGYLDEHERSFLVGSHQRALASAHVAPYNQILASQGQQGLLRAYRNEQLGIPVQQPPQAPIQHTTAAAPAPVTQAPTTVPTRANTAALPDFTFGQASRTANELCNEVNILTAANGGLTTANRVTDANFALNEQFCLARTQAMAESSRIEATIPNLTAPQIEQQCEGLSQAIAPQLVGIETAQAGQVLAKTSAFLRDSGKPMNQLISGGKVCLGIGYRTDNAKMAMASGLLLAGAGELGYGETVSHHLREGIGTNRATGQQSTEWMRLALNGVQAGSTVPGQSADRIAVLNAAVNAPSAGAVAFPVFPTTTGN